jgi:hypothetical protein
MLINRVMNFKVNLILIGLMLLTLSASAADFGANSNLAPQCVFDHKDYDSAGFSLPVRKGLHIRAQFGCVYSCRCGGRQVMATHVLQESHFDMDFKSSDTGGPRRAKWFICPYSIKPESWTPRYNPYGELLYYDVEAETRSFDAARAKLSGVESICDGNAPR